jgi:hypothetical protein
MISTNQRVSNNNWCLLDPIDGESSIVLFLPIGDTLDIDLRGLQVSGTSFSVQWYDPRNGGDLQNGTITTIRANTISSIGFAPYNTGQDWAVLLQCQDCFQVAPTAIPNTTPPSTTFIPGTSSPSTERASPSSVPLTTSMSPTAITIPDSIPTMKPMLKNSSVTKTFGPTAKPSRDSPASPTFQSYATIVLNQTFESSVIFHTFFGASFFLLVML